MELRPQISQAACFGSGQGEHNEFPIQLCRDSFSMYKTVSLDLIQSVYTQGKFNAHLRPYIASEIQSSIANGFAF